mgnify:FL=1
MDRYSESKTNVRSEDELCEAILQQKDAEVSALNKNAEAVESKILQEGEEQAGQIREKILAETQARVRQFDEEAAAELSQKHRFAWLGERDKLLKEVFVTLVSRFPEAVKSPEYAERLPAWIQEALIQVQAEQASISLDAYSDQLISDEQITEIGKRLNADLRRGEILSQGHGIFVTSLDGRRSIANTFEARLERQKPRLRILAARFLLGE